MAHLLVVDSDTSFVSAARQSLERVGLEVATAGTIALARTHLKDPLPLAMVLSDVLPDGTAETLLAEAYAVPVVLIASAPRDATAALVHRVLLRPVPLMRLRRALATVPALAQASRDAPPEHAELDLATTVQLFDDFLVIAQRQVQTMREALTQLEGTTQAQALESLRVEGHRLKGSGAAYGLPEVTRLGGELEIEASTGAPAKTLQRLVDAMETRLGQVKVEASL